MKRLIVGLALSILLALGCADDPAQSLTWLPQGNVILSIPMEAATPLANNRLALVEAGVARTPFVNEGGALVVRLTDYPAAPAVELLDDTDNPVRLDDVQCDRLVGALTLSFGSGSPRPAVKPASPRTNLMACPFN